MFTSVGKPPTCSLPLSVGSGVWTLLAHDMTRYNAGGVEVWACPAHDVIYPHWEEVV